MAAVYGYYNRKETRAGEWIKNNKKSAVTYGVAADYAVCCLAVSAVNVPVFLLSAQSLSHRPEQAARGLQAS